MMYTLPFYPHGLENLWHDIKSPFITFSESELVLPIEDIKQIAMENDSLGMQLTPDDEKQLTAQAKNLVVLATECMTSQSLESSCKNVLRSHQLRGLSYYLGKLQNELNKEENSKRIAFEGDISDIWEELQNTEWAEEEMANASHLTSSNERYDKILRLFNNRIADNINTINSLMPRIFMKKRLEAKNKDMKADSQRLEEMKNQLDELHKHQNYINNTLCKTLRDDIGHDSDGVNSVVAHIRTRENKLDLMKRSLNDSGWGRVVKLGVPSEYIESLSFSGQNSVNLIQSAQTFVSTFKIDKERVVGLISNRISQSSSYALKIGVAPSSAGNTYRDQPKKTIFLMCNENDESLIAPYQHVFGEIERIKINPEQFTPGRYVFVHFYCGLQLEDIKDFTYRKKEYESGDLARTTGTDKIGTIFAHPEWFPEDENVKQVFKKVF